MPWEAIAKSQRHWADGYRPESASFRLPLRLHPAPFRFEVSVNQLIFNLDFQVVIDCLRSATTFCKAALSWVWQSHKSGRSYQTDYQFYGRCRVAFGVLHFWHMAIDTGHVVFA